MDIERFGLKGKVELLHFRKGEIISERKYNNLITAAGMAEVAGLINEATSGGFKWIALGTSSTAPNTADTTLGSEIASGGGERASADTINRTTTTYTNDTSQWVETFSFTVGTAVRESGLFDAASTGVLLARGTFAVVNVSSGDSLQVTWKTQVS